MYVEFLETIVTYIKALNAVEPEESPDGVGLIPYLGKIEVKLDGELCGHLVDEVGGQWSYVPVAP